MFPAIAPLNNNPLFPPVRRVSAQYPDGKAPPQTQPALNASHSDLKASVGAVPPAGWLPKPQLSDAATARQSRPSGKSMQRKISSSIPPIRPLKPVLSYSRPRSKSTPDSSGGYSCFHVVKPYKAGYYTIHPEFMSEWLH
ncbi:uncharacterized protein [Salminus brasiliensis]|uniref:uncharacterized protein n=1 Tax=Salminus brasiliensis TaxID=930266 RepID=UPI003B8329A6